MKSKQRQIWFSCLCLLSIVRLLVWLFRHDGLSKYYSSLEGELTADWPPLLSPAAAAAAAAAAANNNNLHDEDSLTTFVWERGFSIHTNVSTQQDRKKLQTQPFLAQPHREQHAMNMNVTIDAASIGSGNASAMTRAQLETWGRQVRYFFGATESDDVDPNCNDNMTSIEMVMGIKRICRKGNRFRSELAILPIAFFASKEWLLSKANPIGWLCAQQRFPSMLGKIGRFYQRELAKAKDAGLNSQGVLPDFLLIQDDDTYFNMNMLQRDLFSQVNPSTPFASTGCLVHGPIGMLNFSFPFGGYGTILSQGAILRMIRPIYCNFTTAEESSHPTSNKSIGWWDYNDDPFFVNNACIRLEKNSFGEQSAFRNGMSVSDLMRAHAADNPYRDYQKWRSTAGYCYHSDWILGYYINYYNLGSPPNDGPDKNLPYFNMDKSLGYIYGTKKATGNCLSEGENCPSTAHVCHRQNPETMTRLDLAQNMV